MYDVNNVKAIKLQSALVANEGKSKPYPWLFCFVGGDLIIGDAHRMFRVNERNVLINPELLPNVKPIGYDKILEKFVQEKKSAWVRSGAVFKDKTEFFVYKEVDTDNVAYFDKKLFDYVNEVPETLYGVNNKGLFDSGDGLYILPVNIRK